MPGYAPIQTISLNNKTIFKEVVLALPHLRGAEDDSEGCEIDVQIPEMKPNNRLQPTSHSLCSFGAAEHLR